MSTSSDDRPDRIAGSHDGEVDDIRDLFRQTRPVAPPFEPNSLSTAFPVAHRRTPSPSNRGGFMAGRWKVAAVVALAAVILLAAFSATSSTQAAPAFAAVLDRVKSVQSVQYTRLSTKSGVPVALADHAVIHDPQSELPPVLHVKVLGRHLQRCDVPGGSYDIIDSKAGALVNVQPGRRLFRRVTTIVRIDPETGRRETEPYQVPPIDFYALLSVQPNDVQPSGRAMVEGQPAIGYRRTTKTGLKTWTTTFWIDPDTHLPLRIETTMRTTEPGIQQWDIVATNFVFDEPLDESLFDLTPPKGYDVTNGEVFVRP